MTTTKQPKRRFVRPCGCHYQREKPWGYEIQKWIGGRKSWRFVSSHKTAEGAQAAAERYPFVLIRCRGCGAEQVREMPASA